MCQGSKFVLVQGSRFLVADCEWLKKEMQLLKKFDQLAFSVDEYVNTLDVILAQKVASISDLRQKIAIFKSHLQEEEVLSSSLKGGPLPFPFDQDGARPR